MHRHHHHHYNYLTISHKGSWGRHGTVTAMTAVTLHPRLINIAAGSVYIISLHHTHLCSLSASPRTPLPPLQTSPSPVSFCTPLDTRNSPLLSSSHLPYLPVSNYTWACYYFPLYLFIRFAPLLLMLSLLWEMFQLFSPYYQFLLPLVLAMLFLAYSLLNYACLSYFFLTFG